MKYLSHLCVVYFPTSIAIQGYFYNSVGKLKAWEVFMWPSMCKRCYIWCLHDVKSGVLCTEVCPELSDYTGYWLIELSGLIDYAISDLISDCSRRFNASHHGFHLQHATRRFLWEHFYTGITFLMKQCYFTTVIE